MKSYELVVIGSGGAGLSAACHALENGIKSIAVVEVAHAIGGISKTAGGFFFAPETHYAEGFENSPTVAEAVKQALEFHHYEFVTPQLISKWLSESKNTISWMESRGYKFAPFSADGCSLIINERMGPGNVFKFLAPLAEELKEKGVDILLHTSAESILRDENGVAGVEIRTAEGEKDTIRCSAVVLACGGFMADKEKVMEYFPDYYTDNSFSFGIPNTGNGIELAKSAGAKLNRECTLVIENGFCFDRTNPAAPGRIHNMGCAVHVNTAGKRFVDESVGAVNYAAKALVKQEGKIAYAIFSSETLEHVLSMTAPENYAARREGFEEYMNKEAAKRLHCIYAESLDEAAEWIGADPEVLKKTIADYNGFCESGTDAEIGKPAEYLLPLLSGPYFVVRFRPLYIDTIGPVNTDESMRVLDAETLRPIRGMYAAGSIVAGWQGKDYYQFGANLSFCFTSGMIAGKTAAQDAAAE